MEDIFLNADIRLVQDDKYAVKPITINQEFFEELSKCPELLRLARGTTLHRAYTMLANLKESLSLFYVCKPPINRKERRERARKIKREILCFRAIARKTVSALKITKNKFDGIKYYH